MLYSLGDNRWSGLFDVLGRAIGAAVVGGNMRRMVVRFGRSPRRCAPRDDDYDADDAACLAMTITITITMRLRAWR